MRINISVGKTRKSNRNKKNKHYRFIAVALLLLCLAVTGIWQVVSGIHSRKTAESDIQNVTVAEEKTTDHWTEQETAVVEEILPYINFDGMYSQEALLIRLSDGKIIGEQDADLEIYPASMTKIMTAIVGIENLTYFKDTIEINYDTYNRLVSEDSSMAGFVPGDEVEAIDLLYGLLLCSGGECCASLGEYLFGSEEALVEKMNEKAQELGMNSTHFVTSTGLHDSQHYTTLSDLSIVLTYALKNPVFRKIYTTPEYTTSPLASNPEGLHFQATMYSKMEELQISNGEVEGGKTGYTSEAGLCLASLAKVDGTEYILITAGADGNPYTDPYQVMDAVYIYNQLGMKIP